MFLRLISLRDVIDINQHVNICDENGNLIAAGIMNDLLTGDTFFIYGDNEVLYIGTEYYSNTLYIRIVRY